jgi:DNA-binding CsgD family transcriptional regulator
MQLHKKTERQQAMVPKSKPTPLIPDVGLILLDCSLKPLAFDRGAVAILNHPNQPAIPEEILKDLRGLSPADWSSTKSIFRRGKSEYVCQAFLLECQAWPLEQFIVVLHLEKRSSMDNAIHKAVMKYGLTVREREALEGITMGLSNKQLSERMNISPNTVRSFLRLVMVKMSVASRSAMVAKLLQDRGTSERLVGVPSEEELAV